ncbi:hypothetical protein GF336_03050 [Candidatus Woesearchaeota archaeon]|nr:hypothetical protein [Candidatus Woesearchaeota archaeon]
MTRYVVNNVLFDPSTGKKEEIKIRTAYRGRKDDYFVLSAKGKNLEISKIKRKEDVIDFNRKEKTVFVDYMPKIFYNGTMPGNVIDDRKLESILARL